MVFGLFLPISGHLDLQIASCMQRSTPQLGQTLWAQALYTFGAWPAIATGCAALVLWVGGAWWPSLRVARRGALLFLCVFALGTGALTHLVLKELWNRPRPRQVLQFGGTKHFSPIYQLHGPTFPPQRSFPSGHVGCGACFLALERVGAREKRRFLRLLGLVLAVVFGGGLALVRIAQNGHFFSDAVGTYYVLWCVCLIGERVLYGTDNCNTQSEA